MGISMIICSMLSWSVFYFYLTNSYQIFVPAIAAERGIDFASLNMWNTYGGLVTCVATLAAAYVVRRTGPKLCMATALILAGLNYTFMPSYPTMVLGLGIAVNAILQVFYCNLPTNVLMANWYPRKNAVVMGWVTAAITLGGAVYLPLFNRALENKGIVSAMRLFGIPVVIFGIVCCFWVKNTPEEVGLEPDGMPMSDEERRKIIAKKNERNPWTLPKVLSNKRMLAFSVAWGLEFMAGVGFATVGVPVLVSKGMTQGQAVSLAAFGALLNLLGSVLSGVIAEKFGTVKASAATLGVHLFACLLLAVATSSTPQILVAGYIINMIVTGAPSNLTATGALRLAGARYFTLAWGTIFMIINLFRAFASSVVSVSLKITGSFNGALYSFVGMLVVAIILIIFAGEKYQEPPAIEE